MYTKNCCKQVLAIPIPTNSTFLLHGFKESYLYLAGNLLKSTLPENSFIKLSTATAKMSKKLSISQIHQPIV